MWLIYFTLAIHLAYLLYIFFLILIKKKTRHEKINLNEKQNPVSIIIACYNEDKYIKQRLDFFLSDEEWIVGSEIIVVSNGSTDSTNKILSSFVDDKRVNTIIFTKQIGKIASINIAVDICKNEILILSDCRQMLSKKAIKKLVGYFVNQDIAVVNVPLTSKNSESKFGLRNIINKINAAESESGLCMNIYGSLYAIKKSLFIKVPENVLFDDLFMLAYVHTQRKRVVQAYDVFQYDIPFKKYYRKERIERLTRGLLLFLFNNFKLLSKLPPRVLLKFLLHKYFKLVSVLLIALCLIFIVCNPHLFFIQLHVNIMILVLALFYFFSAELRLIFSFYFFSFLAILKFFFLKKKSNKWEKLNTIMKCFL